MDKTAAKRAEKPRDTEIALRNVSKVGLAMCNAERRYFMLMPISDWSELTDEAMEHYRRLAVAAIEAMK